MKTRSEERGDAGNGFNRHRPDPTSEPYPAGVAVRRMDPKKTSVTASKKRRERKER